MPKSYGDAIGWYEAGPLALGQTGRLDPPPAPKVRPIPAWGTAPGNAASKRFEGCKPGIIPAIRNAPDVPGLQPSGSIFAQNSGRQPYAHPIPGRWPSKTGLPRAPWGQFSLFVPFTKSDGTDPWRGKSVNRLRHPWRGKSVNAHPPPPICVHLRIIPPPLPSTKGAPHPSLGYRPRFWAANDEPKG